MFAIALAYTVAPTSNSAAKCVVPFLVIYQFFYNWGISPYTFLIGGEIPDRAIGLFGIDLLRDIDDLKLAFLREPLQGRPERLRRDVRESLDRCLNVGRGRQADHG